MNVDSGLGEILATAGTIHFLLAVGLESLRQPFVHQTTGYLLGPVFEVTINDCFGEFFLTAGTFRHDSAVRTVSELVIGV